LRGRGLRGTATAFSLLNLADPSGFTAALDLDGFTAVDSAERFCTSLFTGTQISPGSGV